VLIFRPRSHDDGDQCVGGVGVGGTMMTRLPFSITTVKRGCTIPHTPVLHDVLPLVAREWRRHLPFEIRRRLQENAAAVVMCADCFRFFSLAAAAAVVKAVRRPSLSRRRERND